MSGIHDLVHMAEISVDAGSKEVYEKVRRGGDWNILMENFEYISSLEIEHFGLSMVVQDSNYKDIPKLIELRDKYFPNGYVYFQKITNWETFSEEEFKKKAVWNENHSEYNELVKILKENVQDRLKDKVASNMVELK
jgi:wyosine [tRNA(Phe)-imidazoG37] synthetase (radical SAM superfamily)